MNTDALRSIGYGMYVIGARKGDRLNAQIANTVFQITSEPPTVSVSINKQNLTHEYIQAGKVFTVSVLSEEAPMPFIGHFGFKSGREVDKLATVLTWPVYPSCLRASNRVPWLACHAGCLASHPAIVVGVPHAKSGE